MTFSWPVSPVSNPSSVKRQKLIVNGTNEFGLNDKLFYCFFLKTTRNTASKYELKMFFFTSFPVLPWPIHMNMGFV